MPVAVINIDKSIRCKRIVYKITWETFFSYFFTYIGGLMLIIACVAPNFNKHINHPPFMVAICGAITIWMAANLILLNSLARFEVKDIDKNRISICSAIDTLYSGLNLNATGNPIRNVKLANGLRWGRIISVILEGETGYINITTLGRGNSPSPFHGLYNYLKCRHIARLVKKQLS